MSQPIEPITISLDAIINTPKMALFLFAVAFLLQLSQDYYNNDYNPDISAWLFVATKAVGYGLLAFYIFRQTVIAGTRVDILVYFTYLLAVFECLHNLMDSLGKWLSAFFITILDIFSSNRIYK